MRCPKILLAEALEADIIFEHLSSGQPLLEDDISRRYEASGHHVRAAFLILERSGLVIRLRNKGAHVRSFTAQEVRHLYDVREMLTLQAALRDRLWRNRSSRRAQIGGWRTAGVGS
jgi:DNA-binding GntR family transcriptional regulator